MNEMKRWQQLSNRAVLYQLYASVVNTDVLVWLVSLDRQVVPCQYNDLYTVARLKCH